MERHKPTYGSWLGLRQRCNNPNANSYNRYGARGIGYDPRWDSYAAFLEDMGERPPGTSIDRIDNNLGYSKANCRWSTPSEQQRNRRDRVLGPGEMAASEFRKRYASVQERTTVKANGRILGVWEPVAPASGPRGSQ